jgi:hypothetical protein
MYAHRYVVAMVSVKLLAHVNAKTAMLMLIVPMKDVLVVVEDMVNAMRLLKNACVTMVLQGKNARKKHAQINVVNMVCARKNLVIVFAIKIGKDMIVPHQDVQRIVVTMVHVSLHLQVLSVLVIKNGVVIIVIPQLAQQARKR